MSKVRDCFAKIGLWFKSLFVSVDNKKPKFVSLYEKEGTKSILASLICILGGILVGILFLVIMALFSSDINIMDVFKGIGCILGGPLSGKGNEIPRDFGNMLLSAVPLIMTGLAVAFSFKTGLFNIGAPGQYLMGTMGTLLVALSIHPSSDFGAFCVWILAFIVGVLLGAIWGAIPGVFKAIWGVNEVIVCIMTNWIAANLVSWVFSGANTTFIDPAKASITWDTSHNGVATMKLGLNEMFKGSSIDISIILAILIAIVIFVVMNKTTFGFELKATGNNRHAAKYAGMNEKRNIILSLVISGALAGAGAAFYYLNGGKQFAWDTYKTLPDVGFNGIPVALLASNNPIGCIFSAILLCYLNAGGTNISAYTNFNSKFISSTIIAVILYFAGFAKLIRDIMSKGNNLERKNAYGKKEKRYPE